MATEEEDVEKLPFKILSWTEKDFMAATCPSAPVKSEIKLDIKQEPEDDPTSKLEINKSNIPFTRVFLLIN